MNINDYMTNFKDYFGTETIKKDVCFFGAGRYCDEVLTVLEGAGHPLPIAICDNDEMKWGQTLRDIPIISLEVALEKYPSCTFLITIGQPYIEEIKQQIKRKTQKNDSIYLQLKIIQPFLELKDSPLLSDFQDDIDTYNKLNTHSSFEITTENLYPVLKDKYAQAGGVHYYFWQDLWGAKWVAKNNPAIHYDIGSRLDGFIAHLLSFRDAVNLIDIRPLDTKIPGLSFTCADATNLENIPDESIESLSALCSIEHFGLGRYGDPIDPDACFKAFTAVQRVMKPGADLYISLPVDSDYLAFNGHRCFAPLTVKNIFSQMELIEYLVIVNDKEPVKADVNQTPTMSGTGLFYFKKTN